MKRKVTSLFLLFLFVLVSCAGPAQQTETSPTEPAVTEPPLEPTEEPVVFGVTSLVVEGDALEPVDNVYEYVSEVKPGDFLRVEITVADSASGSITFFNATREYKPGETVVFAFNIPANLASSNVDILLESADGGTLSYVLRLANPGAGFEPAVLANVSEVYAGTSMTTPLEVKSLNGETYEVTGVQQVLGLGDQYSGDEYVTSQELAELSLNGNELSFLANTPGNYRLTITASSDSNSGEFTLDVPVYWEPGRNPFSIRGVGIDTWGPPDWVNLDNVPNIIDIAADYGANYVQLVPWWNANGTASNHTIVPCTVEAGCTTPDDDVVRAWIQHAHAKGMMVMLKPHIIGGVFDRSGSHYDFESWQIKPSNPDQWFEEYTNFILHYARIAEEEGVEMFAVGNELQEVQTDIARWTDVINAVKEVYHGPLTYSDTRLNSTYGGQVTFWNQLDYVGISYYYSGPKTTTPTIPEIKSAIEKIQAQNLATTMSRFESTPIIATEIGRPNFDGTVQNFTNWTGNVDHQEAVDFFEASFNNMVGLGSRFSGFFFWKLETGQTPGLIGWDFRDKPLGEALRFWWSN